MATFRVSFTLGFAPALTIARQQQLLERLEAATGTQNVDLTERECRLDLMVNAARADLAGTEAEARLAALLAAAGHTRNTAPIRSRTVNLATTR